MRKKTLVVLALLSMGLGLPASYFQAIVSAACDNYCFSPGYPTPPLLYLWFPLFLLGSLLGLLTWAALFARQISQRKWTWMGFTLINGGISFFGFFGALLGVLGAAVLLLVCALDMLITLLFLPEVPQPNRK